MKESPVPPQQRSGFAADVAGQRPHVVDRELSALLQDNYIATDMRRGSPDMGVALPGSWTRMGEDELLRAGIDPTLLHDGASGFDASFYRNAEGAVVLAFTGTDEGQDWRHNIRQGLGLRDDQYDAAMKLAVRAKASLGDQVVFTGHSLGGGLAAAAAMATDTPAVTFNAAGVHDRTLEREGLDPDEAKSHAERGLIRSYVVRNEILTHLQEDSLPLRYAMPDAPGHRIELPDPDPLSFFERLMPGRMLMHRLDLHYIDAVMQAQDLATLDARGRSAAATTAPDAPGPGSRLLQDSARSLAPQRRQLGLADDERFLNAVASIAAHADRDGLRRIDHVVPSTDGRTLFAVQGELRDPVHRRSAVDLDQATEVAARISASELRAHAADPLAQEQRQEHARRMALA